MQDFRNLHVWQKARGLANQVYDATEHYPLTEVYGLRAQMRRASISICANLAEGCGRASDDDFRRFVVVAMGSACELECETILSADRALMETIVQRDLLASIVEVKCMLTALIKTLAESRGRSRREKPALRADSR